MVAGALLLDMDKVLYKILTPAKLGRNYTETKRSDAFEFD